MQRAHRRCQGSGRKNCWRNGSARFWEYITEWNSNAYIPVDVLIMRPPQPGGEGSRWHQASEKGVDVIFRDLALLTHRGR